MNDRKSEAGRGLARRGGGLGQGHWEVRDRTEGLEARCIEAGVQPGGCPRHGCKSGVGVDERVGTSAAVRVALTAMRGKGAGQRAICPAGRVEGGRIPHRRGYGGKMVGVSHTLADRPALSPAVKEALRGRGRDGDIAIRADWRARGGSRGTARAVMQFEARGGVGRERVGYSGGAVGGPIPQMTLSGAPARASVRPGVVGGDS